MQTIGFIGLGTMGGAMAGNLLKGGFSVRGFDIDDRAVGDLAAAGGIAAASPRIAAEGADLVITMLPNAPHIEAALTGADGILEAAAAQPLLMNSSTIDPGETRRLAGIAQAAGWSFLDCPIGRTALDAVAGRCLFMLGGAADDKAAVRPVLEAMGDTIVDCGEVGHASTVKIANNYLSIIGAVITAEALRFAEAGGVSPETAFQIINSTVAMNGHTKLHYPKKALAGDVTPGFAIEHAAKDLGIAVEAMAREGVPCFIGPGGLEAYEKAMAQGRGKNDWSDLYNVVGELWREGSKA